MQPPSCATKVETELSLENVIDFTPIYEATSQRIIFFLVLVYVTDSARV